MTLRDNLLQALRNNTTLPLELDAGGVHWGKVDLTLAYDELCRIEWISRPVFNAHLGVLKRQGLYKTECLSNHSGYVKK